MVNLFDPFGIAKSALDAMEAASRHPELVLEQQATYSQKWLDLVEQSVAAFAGEAHQEIVQPASADRRFVHPAWTENPAFDSLKEAYLLATEAIVTGIEAIPDLDPAMKRRARFWARQFCDAVSPTNVAWLNPAVIDETVRTGGQNLVRGMEHLLADLRENDGRVRLVDTTAFTLGENIATTQGKVIFRNALMELIQYAPSTQTVARRPLVIVPPWINKFYVLDLQPTNSVVKYLVDNGFTTFMISWRNPDPSMADLTMEDYLREGPQTAIRVAREICGTRDVNALGYCIGGTLLAIELAYAAAKGERSIKAATFLASLVDFEEPGEIVNFLGPEGLAFVEERMREHGVLEGREMADSFNLLRANDLIWNVAVSRYLLGKDAPAFDLLYWNNDATRMPRAMHSYYLETMYRDNALVRPGGVTMFGTPIDLGSIENDLYIVSTAEDHIAPWTSVYRLTQLVRGMSRVILGSSGHIAGIINAPAKQKGAYWASGVNPPSPQAWQAGAEHHDGSWWPDWVAWLRERSGKAVDARVPGSVAYPALADAPGTYVLEK
jgi:polyhydroxyalkanoate synthase subunit PhaC